MGLSIFRQDTQVRKSEAYVANIAPSLANFETTPASLEDDLSVLRSAHHLVLKNQAGNWYDDLNVPATLENGAKRGVNDLNSALHLVEKKRVLRDKYRPGNDVAVTAAQNWQVLALGELPTNTTAAVGSVTTLGTVAAFHSGTFGTHSLDEVSGTNNLNPKNLCNITDAASGDPILSGGRTVYALFQTETATDGHTMTGTTPNRAQLSFVRPNATFDDLEACPVGDIAGKTINYSTRERVRLEDLNEQDFLKGAVVDIPAGSTPTRQSVYDNQGVTPVDQTTNATLDLEGAGLAWTIRDDTEADLFKVIEGSAGGTSEVQVAAGVDKFNVDAVDNDFLNGIKVDTGAAGTTINVGITPNQIDAGGVLKVASGGGADLSLAAALELNLTDSYRAGSTWSLADGLALAGSSAEWSAFETQFGEVSLLNAIVQAKQSAYERQVWAVATSNVNKDTDVSGPSNDNNLDTDLGDLSSGTFVDDYEFYLNGQRLRPGANAAANHDVYPGTSLANGQLKFEFKIKNGDQLLVVDKTP